LDHVRRACPRALTMEHDMKTHMKFGASALALLLSTAAFAAVDQIREIDVTADVSAIQNEAAALYWGNLEADLEAAIAARVSGLMTEEERAATQNITSANNSEPKDGSTILVDIREVELTNSFGRALNLGDAVLVGQVNIVDLADNSNADGYELSVSLETANVVVPAGQTMMLNADDSVTYHLLVDAFAQAVVDRLN
jgi:hypothetical protein